MTYAALRALACQLAVKTTRTTDGKLKNKEQLIASVKRKDKVKA